MRHKKKKKKKEAIPEYNIKDKRAEIITLVVIAVLTILGLLSGYMMYNEFAGNMPQKNMHHEKTETKKGE